MIYIQTAALLTASGSLLLNISPFQTNAEPNRRITRGARVHILGHTTRYAVVDVARQLGVCRMNCYKLYYCRNSIQFFSEEHSLSLSRNLSFWNDKMRSRCVSTATHTKNVNIIHRKSHCAPLWKKKWLCSLHHSVLCACMLNAMCVHAVEYILQFVFWQF